MKTTTCTGFPTFILALAALGGGPGVASVVAADGPATSANEAPAESGRTAEARYSERLAAVRTEIAQALPVIDEQKRLALVQAIAAVKAALQAVEAPKKALEKIQSAKGLVEHAKKKWIGDAQKNIDQAEATLQKAGSASEREAAQQTLAKWQANKEAGITALKEREAAYQQAMSAHKDAEQVHKLAQEKLTRAQADEVAAADAVLAELKPTLANDRLDRQLLTGVVLAHATPRGLAVFAQQSTTHEALVEQLLSDTGLKRQMLDAGGAAGGHYGRAMEIYDAIRRASPHSANGTLQRLALATSLEHATPVAQLGLDANERSAVDPVKRYQHYEKAFLAGELDPAFNDLTTWEYRMVVDCDATDDILAWGREMLRNYRPDHIANPDYGWRYVGVVRSDVTYGSENVKCDLPSLHNYQNIIKNGGVCGRRAFFGRFILKSFGIPTWGVTQHKHAAVSHWTPDGWVVNLGAGFQFSWWDKDDAPRSGVDFLLETQARKSTKEYPQALRAAWISRVLGETPYNERKNIDGGFWSRLANYQARSIVAASKAKTLGPLGQELAEANEPRQSAPTTTGASMSPADRAVRVDRDGTITIPAVAHRTSSGSLVTAKSHTGGMQIHAANGLRAEYDLTVAKAGKYHVTARVVTVQDGQKMVFAANESKAAGEVAVPYTIGTWALTPAQVITLVDGKNVLHVTVVQGSRGVTVKEFILTPVR
jgi:hypothetical protein